MRCMIRASARGVHDGFEFITFVVRRKLPDWNFGRDESHDGDAHASDLLDDVRFEVGRVRIVVEGLDVSMQVGGTE